ncbi:TIR domain-containing protein [Paenarthrobacter ureafaciens]|uniref:TIR domain-containing protein n=1 Tax=Paenarthrobacter ureafaciens TaxID=37931 RepID=UPI001FB35DB3|nr:TIR domain-containing protein [Paenarthrobacter ureafaciens]UOD83349.1 toll/interleukin-1 receptor domain-containing protein [Paenarthrobacter ureafaciens]WNZ04321.1 TIR domain-containing protein [Paenarthrobacter ureafaciens]
MPLDIDKLRLLLATAEQMAAMSSANVNLVLYEAGLGELPSQWYGDDYNGPPDDDFRRDIAQRLLRDLQSAQIREIATALQQLSDAPMAPAIPFEPQPIRLFASHLASQKRLVKSVADALEIFSVSLFVAHVDIAIDDEWHAAIESNLQSVDAGVVFLHPKFNESTWCDQEVGWLLGRGVPVFTLKFAHQDPYGPLGKKQAQVVEPTATASTVADYIVRWMSTKPAIRGRLNASLVAALQKTVRFADTDRVWTYLRQATDLTVEQVGAVASAVRDNDQVYGAISRVPEDQGQWYPAVILRWLVQQPGYEENKDLVEEVARLRKVEAALSHNQIPSPSSPDTWARSEPPF